MKGGGESLRKGAASSLFLSPYERQCWLEEKQCPAKEQRSRGVVEKLFSCF